MRVIPHSVLVAMVCSEEKVSHLFYASEGRSLMVVSWVYLVSIGEEESEVQSLICNWACSVKKGWDVAVIAAGYSFQSFHSVTATLLKQTWWVHGDNCPCSRSITCNYYVVKPV